MKKLNFKKKLKILFWTVFIVGTLWVALAPHSHRPVPNTVTVKVQPYLESQPPLPGEKPTLPSQIPTGGEEQIPQTSPHGENVIVPVAPEKEDNVLSGRLPRIAIVIDDVGVDLKGSERAIKLPASITLSFLPYAVRLREQTKEARDNGHELILHMPMEPIGHEDPGPGALLVDLPMRDLQQRFETALASFTGFDGVNNHMGSKFTAYPEGMTMVMDELQQRHLFFLDSRTSAQSVGKQIAEEKGIPTIGRDVFLDDIQTPDAIRTQLEETERIAKHKGYVVAIGHPHSTTMDIMNVWVTDVQKRGFELVPLHSLIKQPEPHQN